MKNLNKTKIISIALVISMLAILSVGTLAWFNDTDQVVNKFYVADSNGDGTPDFSVDVEEQDADEDGNPIYDDEGNPVFIDDGNVYKDILPGSRLTKNAAVENTGDYDQWIRLNFTLSDSAVWQQAIAKAAAAEGMEFDEFVFEKLFTGFIYPDQCEAEYVRHFNAFGEDTMTYTVYYNAVLTPGERIEYVLEDVVIPGVLEQEDMNFGTGEDAGFTLTIMAEAVQVENLNATCASEAFAEVGWEVGTSYGQ